jgi:hypothetical protein
VKIAAVHYNSPFSGATGISCKLHKIFKAMELVPTNLQIRCYGIKSLHAAIDKKLRRNFVDIS